MTTFPKSRETYKEKFFALELPFAETITANFSTSNNTMKLCIPIAIVDIVLKEIL